jgi:hypothetical protein
VFAVIVMVTLASVPALYDFHADIIILKTYIDKSSSSWMRVSYNVMAVLDIWPSKQHVWIDIKDSFTLLF